MEQRSLFANSISLNTKRLSQNNYQESVRFTTVTLCAISTSVILRLPPSPPFLFVPSHLSDIALPPSPPWHCVPYSIRTLVYHSIFWKLPPHLTNAPHIWCEGLAPHVRRTYNITRIGKTSAGVWWMVRHIGRENWR